MHKPEKHSNNLQSESLSADADASFARLEELVALLPAIQEKDALLSQARAARQLLAASKRQAHLQKMLDGYEQTMHEALRAAKRASDEGDAEAEGPNLTIARINKELHYTQLASLQRAGDEVRNLLASGSLTLEDPLEEFALSDEEYQALKEEVIGFQEEYQQVYELCKKLEGLE